MKSEHRHELAENDLGKLIRRWRERLEPYSNKVLLGLLAATVVIGGGVLAWRTLGASSRAGATELAAARTAAEYEAVAENFEGSLTGLWARLRAGEEYLRDGIRLSLSNRTASNERLEEAQRAFERVLKAENVPPELREKALYGLAVCLESQSSAQTGTQPAVDAYEQLLKQFPETRYRYFAEQRIKVLKSEEAQQFYAWFHAQTPRPEDRPSPQDFPFPFPSEGGDPFLDRRGPADMPADDAGTPAASANSPSDAAAEPPPPPTSERRTGESGAAAEDLPALPQQPGEEAAAPGETATEPDR